MNSLAISETHPPEASVYQRYAAAAGAVEPALCCPVEYSTELLDVIPEEIIERDYGCGDPTPFIRSGETVLDLGSGAGKLCYIAAQVVGLEGRVIGVDCNREMLNLARKHAPTVAERVGYANVDFRYGLIQDLELDLDQLAVELSKHPVNDPAGYLALRHIEERLRRDRPLIADDSVDWQGRLFDCDFNQMLNLELIHGMPNDVRDFDAETLSRREIMTGRHCFGCTAGSGSGCQGAVVKIGDGQ